MNHPKNFHEALQFAEAAALSAVNCRIERAAAAARAQMAEHHFDYAKAHHFDSAYLAQALQQVDDAREALYMCESALDFHSTGIPVWSSGYLFDDRGNEYQLHVDYMPLEFCYTLTRSYEADVTRYEGRYATAEAAVAAALGEGEEPNAEPTPPNCSFEESTTAGDILVMHQSMLVTVKGLVDRTLNEAYHGCGQHYEIYARRAYELLDRLPFELERPEDRAALDQYLAYDRV